jgi:hypothetical protein
MGVTTNTSWALFPSLATSLCPPVIGAVTLSRKTGLRPFTLQITAGVTVSIPGTWARRLSKGINPSM